MVFGLFLGMLGMLVVCILVECKEKGIGDKLYQKEIKGKWMPLIFGFLFMSLIIVGLTGFLYLKKQDRLQAIRLKTAEGDIKINRKIIKKGFTNIQNIFDVYTTALKNHKKEIEKIQKGLKGGQ